MSQQTDHYDFFVSYARADNASNGSGPGWVEQFVNALLDEHRRFTGGRSLRPFFDRRDISNFASWESEIFHKGLTRSRLFLAFLSPAYFASEVCRKEWKAWIDQEIATHILGSGAAPVYLVEVPGFVAKPMLSEQDVARKVAELSGLTGSLDRFLADVSPVMKEARRRQVVSWVHDSGVRPFFNAGVLDLQQADLQGTLSKLAEELDTRVEDARRAADSVSTVPPYNRHFTGRLDELLQLRRMLKDDRTGVVCGVAGLGGIGKTELAYTYAHAFAGVYPGGRFHIPCDGKSCLRQAMLTLGDHFRDRISDEERMHPDAYFAAITRCLRQRLSELGSILLVLDNVTDTNLVSRQQTDDLTALGPHLHLLATTRLLPPTAAGWLTLGELSEDDALVLLEKFRPFSADSERDAAREIVRRLGGFALAIELIGAGLAARPSATYASVAADLGLDDLDMLAECQDIELRRHNHEKRLSAVLQPTLDLLTPAERRALEYAALLPPDQVPLPWLRELTVADFPALAQSSRWGDPWHELCRQLERLALWTPAEGEGHTPQIVRVHRLVQELVRDSVARTSRPCIDDGSARTLDTLQESVNALIGRRDAALEKTTHWQEARWELAPLEALASLWADTGHESAAWLLNQAAIRLFGICEWSRTELLMRRILAIRKESLGEEHPDYGTSLNNLGRLLRETNRMAEAEPLLRQAAAIYERSCGPDHPWLATTLNNLGLVLWDTNRLAEVEPLYRRALAIDELSYGDQHPSVARDLSNLGWLLKETNRLAEAEPLMRRALAIDELSYGEQHPSVAIDLNNLALLLHATNRLAEAEPLMRRALAIDELSYGDQHPRVAGDLNNLALLLQATNRLAEAEPLMRRALTINELSYGDQHPRVAGDLNNLALLLQATNRLAEAEPLLRRALAICNESLGEEHPDYGTSLNTLGNLLREMNRMAEAEPLLRQAAAIHEQSYGPDHPLLATDLNNLALLLQATNRLAEAEPLYRRALAIDELSYGDPHPLVARDLHNLAALLKDTNRLAEAEPLMRRALAIDELSYGVNHPAVATRLNNLAQLLQATNRLVEAELLMHRALAIRKESLGEDHPDYGTSLNNLGNLLRGTNRMAEAEPLLRQVAAIYERSFGPDHPWLAIAFNNLAQLLQATNRQDEAEPLYRRALAIDELSYGDQHPDVARDLHNLAALLKDKNRLAEAEPLMRRALAIFEAGLGLDHPSTVTVRRNLERLLEEM